MSSELKILFLDIDGVLCTLRSHFAYGDKGGLMSAWDITCCQMIRRLCKKYNYKIVISSTWRNSTGRIKVLDYYLAMYGLIDYCYKYPDMVTGAERLKLEDEWKTPNSERIPGKTRGTEIKMWLDKHPEVTKYIIVDDDVDMLDEQKPYLIKTDTDEGFGSDNMMQAMKVMDELDGIQDSTEVI